MFLSPFAAGDKCSGPCAHGYRCPPSCKDLTKEIKKMHDDSHTYSHCYCSHCGTIYCQTLEQEQVTSQERINSCDFSYVETWFAVLTFQRYLETVKKKQSSEEQFCPVSLYLFFDFIFGFQGLVFLRFQSWSKTCMINTINISTRHLLFSFVVQELKGRLTHEQST